MADGDSSRSALATSLVMHMDKFAERPVFESLLMVQWSWELVYECINSLASLTPSSNEDLRALSEANTLFEHAAAWAMSELGDKFGLGKAFPRGEAQVPASASR
jgi:hypothetical protein